MGAPNIENTTIIFKIDIIHSLLEFSVSDKCFAIEGGIPEQKNIVIMSISGRSPLRVPNPSVPSIKAVKK